MTKPKRKARVPVVDNRRVPFKEWADPRYRDSVVRRWELLSVVNIVLSRERERVAAQRPLARLRRKLKEIISWKSPSPSLPDSLPDSPSDPSS